jgi:hypothetical protein
MIASAAHAEPGTNKSKPDMNARMTVPPISVIGLARGANDRIGHRQRDFRTIQARIKDLSRL